MRKLLLLGAALLLLASVAHRDASAIHEVAVPAHAPVKWVGVNYFWAASHTVNGHACDTDPDGVSTIFPRLQASGIEVVRFFAFQVYAPYDPVAQQHDFTAFDTLFNTADQYGLKLIPVMGNDGGECGASAPKDCAWYQSGYLLPDINYLRSYREWVEALVARYSGRPTVKVWELVNEPRGTTDCVHPFFVDMLALVRSLDGTTPRSIGGNGAGGWDFRVENANPDVTWTTIHNYDRWDNPPSCGQEGFLPCCSPDCPYMTMHERVGRNIARSREIGKPIYMGEEGIACSYGDPDARGALYKDKIDAFFHEGGYDEPNGGFGYLLWNYDDDDSPGICDGPDDYGFSTESAGIVDVFGKTRDPDGDGCAYAEESLAATGSRPGAEGDEWSNALYWDFFDVPAPALQASATGGSRNGAVTLADVTAILTFVGTSPDKPLPNTQSVTYNQDVNADGIPDGEAYDRRPSVQPNPPAAAQSPSHAVTLQDASVALVQVGLSCLGHD